MNCNLLGTFNVDRVIAYGNAGCDVITASCDVTVPTWFFGGSGQ